MNIEKIFSALDEDEMNSALGIICSELESQGYRIEIEGIEITSGEVFDNKIPSLEEIPDALNVQLFMNGKAEQKFSVVFVDYHTIYFQESRNVH